VPKTSTWGNGANGGVQDAGDEMSFDAVMLATFYRAPAALNSEARRSAGRCRRDSRREFPRSELGFAVGINGRLGMVFGDGDSVRFAVVAAVGREDELFLRCGESWRRGDDAAGDVAA